VDLGKRGIWWRVYLGPYGMREDADAAATKAKTGKLTDYTRIHRLTRDEVEVGSGRENR
jgi:cell division protein FtsN